MAHMGALLATERLMLVSLNWWVVTQKGAGDEDIHIFVPKT